MANIANDHTAVERGSTRTTAGSANLAPAPIGHPPKVANHASPASHAGPVDRPVGRVYSTTPDARSAAAARYLLAGIRLALGWIFLWAFLDKAFGLGYATTSARSWVNGGSPTEGFLGSAKGPFSGLYHALAGTGMADVLFMVGLLTIGAALILGIGMRLAATAGALLTIMMWTAVLPPASNPFMDDHLVYAAVLIVLALLNAGNTLGLGHVWSATPLVRRATWLK